MLAIVIPYYKRIFFPQTLQSLANQTDKRFKVYIGDDASPEPCDDLIAGFEGKFEFEYVRFDTNMGGKSLTRQWRRCIELTSDEEWLMILGDDDVLEPNCINAFYENINAVTTNDCHVVRFACKVIDADDQLILGPFRHPELETAADFYYRKVYNETRSSLSEYSFKRSAYEKFGFADYPLAWYSDDKAWIDFSQDKPILTINEAFVHVRLSEVNISGREDNIEQKLDAASQFYGDVINPKSTVFSKHQAIVLLWFWEQTVKKHRKLKLNEWKKLFRHYIFYFRITAILKFCRRFLISLFS